MWSSQFYWKLPSAGEQVSLQRQHQKITKRTIIKFKIIKENRLNRLFCFLGSNKKCDRALCIYWKPQKTISTFTKEITNPSITKRSSVPVRLVRAAQVQVMWLYLWTSHFSRAAYFKIMFIFRFHTFFLSFISKRFVCLSFLYFFVYVFFLL